MSLAGGYEHKEGDLDAVPLEITCGYSKDGRPDLKQFVISRVMDGDLPVFIPVLNGNAADKNHFREIVKRYGSSLREMGGRPDMGMGQRLLFGAECGRDLWKL
ncbi:MAG TPA: hypothetical protein ENN68_08150 [Methanomicrobia archaeon]|nr:hypothetical protein [Methanomicrobia archaeon]